MTSEPTRAWEEDVIFVTGYARTGTTLMQGLICTSEDVMRTTAESKFLRGLLDNYVRGLIVWDSHTCDYFTDRDAYRGFTRQILDLYLRHLRTHFATDKRLLQKAVDFAPRIPAVAELLPNAKFVVMVRDPRAVIASQAVRLGKTGQQIDPRREVEEFVSLYALLMRSRSELAGRLAIVRYEHLVTQVDATMGQVGSFLSIRLPANLGSLEWESKRVKAAATASPLDGRPVSAASLTRYRQALAPRVLDLLEHERHASERRIGMSVFYDEGGPNGPAVLL